MHVVQMQVVQKYLYTLLILNFGWSDRLCSNVEIIILLILSFRHFYLKDKN